jgi:hypothetical protein
LRIRQPVNPFRYERRDVRPRGREPLQRVSSQNGSKGPPKVPQIFHGEFDGKSRGTGFPGGHCRIFPGLPAAAFGKQHLSRVIDQEGFGTDLPVSQPLLMQGHKPCQTLLHDGNKHPYRGCGLRQKLCHG